jgi:small-conductance mechanosensitive channel
MASTLQTWWSDPMIGKVVLMAVAIAAILVLIRLLRRAALRRLQDSSARYQARKAVNFVGFAAILVTLLVGFSDKLGGLSVAFGVAGAGVAFALQEVIASMAGWVAVSFGGFYRVGDRVQLGGIKGDVIDIGILRTTVMQIGEWVNADQYNGRIVRVANSFVFKEPVFNYSGDFPFLWDEIMLPIKYGSDYHAARDLLTRIADEVVGDYAKAAELAWEPITRRFLIEKASVLPMVAMAATQNCIELTLRYVVDYKARRTTKDRLFLRLLEEIDRSDGRIGIAAATLNIEKFAPLDVHILRDKA